MKYLTLTILYVLGNSLPSEITICANAVLPTVDSPENIKKLKYNYFKIIKDFDFCTL